MCIKAVFYKVYIFRFNIGDTRDMQETDKGKQ